MSKGGVTLVVMGYSAYNPKDTYRLYTVQTKRIILSKGIKWKPFNQENYMKDTELFGIDLIPGLWDGQSVHSSDEEISDKEESDSDETTTATMDTSMPNLMKPSPSEYDFGSSSIYRYDISESDEESEGGDD